VWPSFYAVFRKEFLHIFRDKGTLRLVLMIPAMQLVLFGFIDQTVHDVPTAVADQDRSTDSRLLIDELRATGTFKIVTMTTSPDEVRQEIRSARARVGVVIPPTFHDRKLRKDNAQVLVLIDGSDSTLSTQALASVNGLIAQDNARLEPVPTAIAAQPIILFNPEGRTANYLIPGLVAVVLMMLGVVLSSSAIVREREKGTFEQLLVTPIHPLGLVLGKLFPYLIFGLVEGAIVLAIMRFGFQVPIRGNLLFLFAAAVLYLLALLPIGLLISSRASTQLESQQLAQAFFLPAIFLSGYVFAFEGLPWALRVIGYVFPTTHMIAIMRGIVLRDASLQDMWPSVCALLATSIVTVFLASRSIHKVAQ